MRHFQLVAGLMTVMLAIGFVGCSSATKESTPTTASTPTAPTADVADGDAAAGLAELSDEDRQLALAQKYCPVERENLLGSMGAPFKLLVDGKPVFLCCEGCKDRALKDSKATLAAVAELKQANAKR